MKWPNLQGRLNLTASGWAVVAIFWFAAVTIVSILGEGPLAYFALVVLFAGGAGIIMGLFAAGRGDEEAIAPNVKRTSRRSLIH